MSLDSVLGEDGMPNFDILDAIIEETLKKVLSVNLEDTPVLFTESAMHNKEFRMRLCEHMFDKHNVPALFIVKDPVLCSFATGRSSALVLDVGHK